MISREIMLPDKEIMLPDKEIMSPDKEIDASGQVFQCQFPVQVNMGTSGIYIQVVKSDW